MVCSKLHYSHEMLLTSFALLTRSRPKKVRSSVEVRPTRNFGGVHGKILQPITSLFPDGKREVYYLIELYTFFFLSRKRLVIAWTIFPQSPAKFLTLTPHNPACCQYVINDCISDYIIFTEMHGWSFFVYLECAPSHHPRNLFYLECAKLWLRGCYIVLLKKFFTELEIK